MKILFIGASNIGHGGRSTIIYNLSKCLYDTCICDFFCDDGVKPSPKIIAEIQNRNGHVFTDEKWENNYARRQLIWFRRLRDVLRQNTYDIIHINMDHAVEAVRAIIGCRIFGSNKIVIHAHNTGFIKQPGIIKRLLAKFMRPLVILLSDAQIACSQRAAEFMYGKRAVNNGKILLLNNGIYVEKYRFNPNVRHKLREEFSLDDKFVIGHVGKFQYQKNHMRIIQIFKKLHEKKKDTALVLVGEGELKKTVYKQVVKEDIENSVIFLGERNDVFNLLQVFDAFIAPSHFEGLLIAGIEAQTAGLPCFFSDVISREAKLTDNVEYISLDEKDEIWVDAILKVMSKERVDESNKIRLAGYDIRESAHMLLDIYYSVLWRKDGVI